MNDRLKTIVDLEKYPINLVVGFMNTSYQIACF